MDFWLEQKNADIRCSFDTFKKIEDHQTKNAQALVEKNAAHLLSDKAAKDEIVSAITNLLNDEKEQQKLKNNIQQLAQPKAAEAIAKEVLALIKK